MKMNTRHAGDGPADVWAFLTEEEADGLANALRSRLDGNNGYRGPGYHLHLEAADGSELTICVLDEPE